MTDAIEFGDKLLEKSKGKVQDLSRSNVVEERPTPELISVVKGLDNATAINAAQKGLSNMLKTFQQQQAGKNK